MREENMLDLSGISADFHDQLLTLYGNMTVHGVRRDEPVRSIFALLGDRWSTLILLVLALGTWRHAELRRILGRLGSEENISQRVLTMKLRALEREGLVARHIVESVPPKVSYSLTQLGSELQAEAEHLIEWVVMRERAIKLAREKFDQIQEK